MALTRNFFKFNLYNDTYSSNEIQILAYRFSELLYQQDKSRLTNSIVAYVKEREKLTQAIIESYLNICDMTLQSMFTEKETQDPKFNSIDVIKKICEQLVGAAGDIMENKQVAIMFYWRIFLHSFLVKKQYQKDKANFMKYVSEQGTYLNDHLFESREICFWDESHKKCDPNVEEYKLIGLEDIYLTLSESINEAGAELGKHLNGIKEQYLMMINTGIAYEIGNGTFKFSDKRTKSEQLLVNNFLVRKFFLKKISIENFS